MGEKKCRDDEDLPLLGEDDLIQKILVCLPVVSLLRFKSVCKSWLDLIESPSFIELHTPVVTTFNSNSNSSSNKFGSFILHTSVQFENFSEKALLRVSSCVSESESESECVSAAVSWCSGSCGMWEPGFNGICGRCATRYKSGGSQHCWWEIVNDGRRRGWCWSTNNNGLCGDCWNPFKVAEKVLKLDNNDFGAAEGSNGEGDNDDDDDDDDLELELVLKFDNLGFPSCYNFGKPIVMVVGSCNGLICLHDSERSEFSLWNPATRQFRILPKPSSITIDVNGVDCRLHRLFAFGFDAKTKDYKVVLISVFVPVVVAQVGCLCRVQVYSLSTDSWRRLKGIKLLPGSPVPCADDDSSSSSSAAALYLNGSCFFMAKFLYPEQCIPKNIPRDNDRFIISLDLTKEIIIPIQLPFPDRDMQLYLSYLGKRIALFMATLILDNDTAGGLEEVFTVWVLNEDGSRSSRYLKKESWFGLHYFHLKGEGNIPRVISNDGVFLLVERGLGNEKKKMMTLYNLVTKKVKKNFIFCDQVLSKAYAYKPSLVSITSEASAAYKKKKKVKQQQQQQQQQQPIG